MESFVASLRALEEVEETGVEETDDAAVFDSAPGVGGGRRGAGGGGGATGLKV